MPAPTGPATRMAPYGCAISLSSVSACAARHAQMGEARDVGQNLMNADHDLLTEDRGKRRQTEVARLVVMLDRDAAVLRVLPLDDVEIGDDLEPADNRRGHRRLDEQNVLELAVDAVADA